MRKYYNQVLPILQRCNCQIDCQVRCDLLSEINIKEVELNLYDIIGFSAYANMMEQRRGGEVFVYVKDSVSFKFTEVHGITFQAKQGTLTYGERLTHILAVYRHPNTNKKVFIGEITIMLCGNDTP